MRGSIALERVRWRIEEIELLWRMVDRSERLLLSGGLRDSRSRSELVLLRGELARVQRDLVRVQGDPSRPGRAAVMAAGPHRFLLRRAEVARQTARELRSTSTWQRARSRQLRLAAATLRALGR